MLGTTKQDGVKAGEEAVIPGTETVPVPPQKEVQAQPARSSEQEGEAPKEKSRNNLYDRDLFPEAAAEGARGFQEANRVNHSIGESSAASYRTWVHNSIIKNLSKPYMAPDPNYSYSARMQGLDYPPTEEEAALFAEAVSDEDFDWYNNNFKQYREDAIKMGDHPVVSFLVGMADPPFIGLDFASMSAGRVLSAGRASGRFIASAGAGVGAYGLASMDASVRPMAESDVMAMVAMNVLGTGAFYTKGVGRTPNYAGGGGLWKSEIPDVVRRGRAEIELAEKNMAATARRVSDEIDHRALTAVETPNGKMKVHQDTTKGSIQLPAIVRESGIAAVSNQVRNVLSAIARRAGGEVGEVAQGLADKLGRTLDDVQIKTSAATKRSYYDADTRTIHLRENAPDWEVNHEIAHAATVDKIAFGRLNPNTAHGKVVRELDDIREAAARAKKNMPDDVQHYLGSTEEFVAGLYSSSPAFRKALARTPDPARGGLRSILDSAIDAGRRILGMTPRESEAFIKARGLAEELMDASSEVKAMNQNAMGTQYPRRYSSPEQAAAEVVAEMDGIWEKVAQKGSWSLHKTLAKFSKSAADFLTDNPLFHGKNSVASHQQSIKNAMGAHQKILDESFKTALANRGASTWKHLSDTSMVMRVQKEINEEVYAEMLRRQDIFEKGMPMSRGNAADDIIKVADDMGTVYREMLGEAQRAGVYGADNIKHSPGYIPRLYNSDKLTATQKRIADMLPGDAKAMAKARVIIRDAFSRGIRKNMGTDSLTGAPKAWTQIDADNVADAMVNRIIRSGEFSDASFRGHSGNRMLHEFRQDLTDMNLPPKEVDRLIEKMTGFTDKADMSARFKNRIRIDMNEPIIMPDGTHMPLSDLLTKDTLNLSNNYVHEMTGSTAFARMGLKRHSEIEKARTQWIRQAQESGQSVPEFEKHLRNTIDQLMGRSVGEDMHTMARMASTASQTLGLKWSGLWQFTEYATSMQKLGIMRVLGSSFMELPWVRSVMKPNSTEAGSIADVLSRNSSQDLRIRPFLTRLEDGFSIKADQVWLQKMQYAKQMVPYSNMMKWVHTHQARVVGNLIQDNIVRAARGNKKAMKSLEMYGIDAKMMDRIRPELSRHGTDTLKWSDGLWDDLRVPLDRMIDSSVLRSRVGEIPTFAAHTTLGKFVFTFQNFVLGAHNKIMMGTLSQQGPAALALMVAYQLPITIATVQARNFITNGEVETDIKELANQTFAQMGAFGLYPQAMGIMTGYKSELGAPGMLGFDRFTAFGASFASGDAEKIAKKGTSVLPLISISPFFNAAVAQTYN